MLAEQHISKRMTELGKLGELTAREYEAEFDGARRAKSRYESARARVERLRRLREPESAESDLFVVRAPVDGVLAARLVEPDASILGQGEDGGTELFRIETEPGEAGP